MLSSGSGSFLMEPKKAFSIDSISNSHPRIVPVHGVFTSVVAAMPPAESGVQLSESIRNTPGRMDNRFEAFGSSRSNEVRSCGVSGGNEGDVGTEGVDSAHGRDGRDADGGGRTVSSNAFGAASMTTRLMVGTVFLT